MVACRRAIHRYGVTDVAKRLEHLMAERRVTQAQLARAVGVTEGAVHLWLVGLRKPGITAARKVAAFFDVSLDDIVFPGELQPTEIRLGTAFGSEPPREAAPRLTGDPPQQVLATPHRQQPADQVGTAR